MIYLFLGKDFNILNKKLNDLILSLNINNIIKYDYSESSIEEILNEVNYIDLFNEKKLIIVSDFSFKKLKNNEEELLLKYIDNMNDNIIIFKCIDESLDERKKITKSFRTKCKVEECKKLDYKELHEYVTNMFKEYNIDITYNQIKRILEKCEYNSDYTISEVEKLIIYKINDKVVNDIDIEEVINESYEKEMFRFSENVLKKDIDASIKSYKILSTNTEEVVMIDFLEKQFRLLLQVKELKNIMDELTLSRELSVNPYTIKKITPYINNYTQKDIYNILYKLSDIDYNIKALGKDKNKELEMFLISLEDINFTSK